jgi:hypothetical protein
MYYYFAYIGSGTAGQYEERYQVYDATGSLVGTYTASPASGGINSVYFDWSVCRYATHSGYGTRGGGALYTWSGGSYGNDSQCYTPASPYHTF